MKSFWMGIVCHSLPLSFQMTMRVLQSCCLASFQISDLEPTLPCRFALPSGEELQAEASGVPDLPLMQAPHFSQI